MIITQSASYSEHKLEFLKYYSSLYSFLHLKKFNHEVHIWSDEKSYESYIKHIPYDKVFIKTRPDFDTVFVNTKSFIIDDDLNDYLDYDIVIQNVVPFKNNNVKYFVFENIEYLKSTKILTKPYDGRCFDTSVWCLITDKFKEYLNAGMGVLLSDRVNDTFILTGLLSYLLAVENDFRYREIRGQYISLNKEDIYKRNVINSIRKRIYVDFPEYYFNMIRFEYDVLSRFKFFEGMNFPQLYNV